MKNKIDKGTFALVLGISVFVVQLVMELFIREMIANSKTYIMVDILVLFILIYGIYQVMKYKERS